MVIQMHVRVGSLSEVTDDDRRSDAEALVGELIEAGLIVDELEVIEYAPGHRGLTLIENVIIFVSESGASAALTLAVEEAFRIAKAAARRRHQKKLKSGRAGRQTGFIIYGPDGKVLRQWSTKDDGDGADEA